MPVLMNARMPASEYGSTYRGDSSSYIPYPHAPFAPYAPSAPARNVVPTKREAMSLGSPARLDFREPGIRGVNAIGSQMTPPSYYTRQGSNPLVSQIPTWAAQQWYGDISAKVGTGQTGAPQVPQMTVPRMRLGPIPKLSVGTGRTNKKQATGLGYTPTGYTVGQYIQAGNGMGQMPGREASFDGTVQNRSRSAGGPSGYPQRGVAAESGRTSMAPTYEPHDFAVGYFFNRHGRQPGSWQETAYGPSYRSLKFTQQPEVYNVGRTMAVHLARPLSQNVYFLAYQTPNTSAARIGAAGMNVPSLGYSGG
jgi:hypothetical protein